jgi:asparagine synthase (glutamine-hydrolysing)
MCGIAGYVPPRLRADVQELRRIGDRMAALLAHRGPDGHGVWVADDGAAVLAHRRLAVVGLGPSGDQPMRARSGRHVITYNGELYNAPAIGRRLEDDGVVFRGTSDTEVLLEAIDRWGIHDALVTADGMFALAVWDERDHRVTLARDRMGEKPLAYGVVDGGLAFTSELQALRVVPGFRAQPDAVAMAQYLRLACVPAPLTAYAGIRKLPPGTLLRVDADEPSTLAEPEPYWSTFAEWEEGGRASFIDRREALDELDHIAADAVRTRLRADVPLGVFLSGGIDSTLVATLAAEQLDRPVRTFTIASDDPDHDESALARAVATRLGADHTQLTVTAADALAEVPTLAEAFDEPFGDSSALPTLLVARLARQQVTVTLSGDGGDELFGGYNRHVWLPETWGRVGRWPPSLRRASAWLLAQPAPQRWDQLARLLPAGRRPRLAGVKAEKLSRVLAADDVDDAYGRLISTWADPLAVMRAPLPTVDGRGNERGPDVRSLTGRLMAADAVTYLPDDVLTKVDRATMAVSLEARVPLLAPAVVRHAARLPDPMRVVGGRGKWALRQLLLRRHPPELVERPKSGFGVPIAAWLRGPLRPWAEDLLSPRSLDAVGLFNRPPIRAAWDDHLHGRRDASYELWTILMAQSWLGRPRVAGS